MRTTPLSDEKIKAIVEKIIASEGISLRYDAIVKLIEGDEVALATVDKFNCYMADDEFNKAMRYHAGKKAICAKGIEALSHIPLRVVVK